VSAGDGASVLTRLGLSFTHNLCVFSSVAVSTVEKRCPLMKKIKMDRIKRRSREIKIVSSCEVVECKKGSEQKKAEGAEISFFPFSVSSAFLLFKKMGSSPVALARFLFVHFHPANPVILSSF